MVRIMLRLLAVLAGSVRLQELVEDMHTLGITAAALQGKRWKSGDPRCE